jgi:hypothetical protein
LSAFQQELRDEGYENVVIIAVGISDLEQYNNNFCSNSDLPLVVDQEPSYPIRQQFEPHSLHKYIVILDYEQNFLGYYEVNGVSNAAKAFVRNILEEHYQVELPGDINEDQSVNVQDIVLLVNMILSGNTESSGDVNGDGTVNVLDVVQVVNIILYPNN